VRRRRRHSADLVLGLIQGPAELLLWPWAAERLGLALVLVLVRESRR